MGEKDFPTSINKDFPGSSPIEILSKDGSLLLRQFTPQDAGDIFALIDRNRTHLSQFGDETAKKYPTIESVKESIEHPKNPKRLRFCMRDTQGIFVGSINITPDESDSTNAEIGYYLGSEFQKQGHMDRAVNTLTEYGFEKLQLKMIYGDVVKGNTTSSNVLLKAGYQETAKHNSKIRYSKQK